MRWERRILRGVLYAILAASASLFVGTLPMNGDYFFNLRVGLGFPVMMSLVGLAASLPRDR